MPVGVSLARPLSASGGGAEGVEEEGEGGEREGGETGSAHPPPAEQGETRVCCSCNVFRIRSITTAALLASLYNVFTGCD